MPYSADIYFQAYQAADPQRRPLVLIHGAGGDHLSWPNQLRRLSGFRVYTPDLPGHGKSRGHGLQGIADYGKALASWIHSLELPQIYLAGHSMGGAIALWLAANHPELIRGLILVSTGARLPVNLTLIEGLATPQGCAAVVDRICSWSFSPGAAPAVVDSVRRSMLANRPSVLGGDFRACDAFDLSGELGGIRVPTLILVGELDKMTPVRFSEGLAAGLPEAALEIMPGVGHMLPLEAPAALAERMRGFLESLSGEASIA